MFSSASGDYISTDRNKQKTINSFGSLQIYTHANTRTQIGLQFVYWNLARFQLLDRKFINSRAMNTMQINEQ